MALSSNLFNLALESVVKETRLDVEGFRVNDDQELVVATYTDDVIMMAENEEDLKKSRTN